LTLSVTIMGEAPHGKALRRDAAQTGDDVWVSGELGLAAMALRERLRGDLALPPDVMEAGLARLERPEPRIALGLVLRGCAHAAIDISDGWLADLGHILERSGKGAELWFDQLPTHPWLYAHRYAYPELIAAGGDDYELTFTAPASARTSIEALAEPLGVRLTRVGRITEGGGTHLLDGEGRRMELKRAGYDHLA
jgi:thiamine-monophosphate kinase